MFTLYRLFYGFLLALKISYFWILAHFDPAENEIYTSMGWHDYKLMKILN